MKTFLSGIARAGRELLGLNGASPDAFAGMCRDLLKLKGEAGSIALADTIHRAYAKLDNTGREAFFDVLRDELEPATDAIESAVAAWQRAPGPATLQALNEASESARRDLIRMLNVAPGGTAALIRMRSDLLALLKTSPEYAAVDRDFAYVFRSWFNRGFLNLEMIDWQTPAMVLEKLIAYEAVHEIQGWDDLRRRLADDRRCFGFFHPALSDEPLIFVEVALVNGLASDINTLLSPGMSAAEQPDTAVFYSISNCQQGLRGISFGNFLIKQVVDMLATEIPSLKTFATLSPLPGFRTWLDEQRAGDGKFLRDADHAVLDMLATPDWHRDESSAQTLQPVLTRLGATYLLKARAGREPRDPVARFHLGNGARLERLNWRADLSEKGVRQSAGLMVNYVYDRKTLLRNHEQYANSGRIASAAAVRKLPD